MSTILGVQKTKLENCEVVTCGLTKEQHDIAVEIIKDNKRKAGGYTLEEVEDDEMVNVWIADAFSEGETEYAHFLQNALAKGADIYTLTDHMGGFSQPIGEVAVYDIDAKEELRENANNVIYDMFSDWDISDAGDLCCNIIDEVIDDVIETSDYPEYNDSDIRIAIKRTIITLTGIGK